MSRLVEWKNDIRSTIALLPLMMRSASRNVREYLVANMMNILFIFHLILTGSIGGYVGLKLIAFFWHHGLIIVWYSFLVVLAFHSLSSHLMMMHIHTHPYRPESQASNVTRVSSSASSSQHESPLRESVEE